MPLSPLALLLKHRRDQQAIGVTARQRRRTIRKTITIRSSAKRWARTGRRLPPIAHYTAALEAAYARDLVIYTRTCARETREALDSILRAYAGERRDDRVDSVIGRLRAQLDQPDRAKRAAARAFIATHKAGQKAANEQVAGLTGGIPIFNGLSDRARDVMNLAIDRNVALITSIPARMLTQVEAELRRGMENGSHVDALKAALQERFEVAESRAELIARDQVLKVNAQLVEVRSRDIGADTYTWRISGSPNGDERVRPMHRELEGSVQRWDTPPVTNEQGDTNNPGEDYQCRCTAETPTEAILDAVLGPDFDFGSEDSDEELV